MTWAKITFGMACCWLLSAAATAQDVPASESAQPAQALAQKEDPAKKMGEKEKKKDDKAQPSDTDFTEAPPPSAEAPSGLNPHMIGDFPGLFRLLTVPVTSLVTVRVRGTSNAGVPPEFKTITVPVTTFRTVRVPIGSQGSFKIAENESVVPQDRVFFTYNYFNNAGGPAGATDLPRVVTQDIIVRGQTVSAKFVVPGVLTPQVDEHRETIGFEKSFFDGACSFGMRMPHFQQNGTNGLDDQGVGDLTLVFKYSPWFNRNTGSGVSVGLALTVPTGPDIPVAPGESPLHPTIIQPYVGYQLSMQNWFLYGFSSLAAPTDSRDVTLMFNDLGLGYRIWQGSGFVSALMPSLEAHLTTPLDHRQPSEGIQGFDQLVLTGGLHIGLGSRSILTLGVASPISSPRLFDLEAIAQFNFRF